MHELRLAPTAANCLSGIVCTPAYVDTTMWLAARYCLSGSRFGDRARRRKSNPPDKVFLSESATAGVRHLYAEQGQLVRAPLIPRRRSAREGIQTALGSVRLHTAGTSGGPQPCRRCQGLKCENGSSPALDRTGSA